MDRNGADRRSHRLLVSCSPCQNTFHPRRKKCRCVILLDRGVPCESAELPRSRFEFPPPNERSMPMRFLITGATGFIGGHIAEACFNRGWQVVAITRPTSDTGLLEKIGATIVKGELNDPN